MAREVRETAFLLFNMLIAVTNFPDSPACFDVVSAEVDRPSASPAGSMQSLDGPAPTATLASPALPLSPERRTPTTPQRSPDRLRIARSPNKSPSSASRATSAGWWRQQSEYPALSPGLLPLPPLEEAMAAAAAESPTRALSSELPPSEVSRQWYRPWWTTGTRRCRHYGQLGFLLLVGGRAAYPCGASRRSGVSERRRR